MDALMSSGVTYMLQNRAEGHGLQLFCKIMSKYTHIQIFLIAAGASKTDSSCLSVLPSRHPTCVLLFISLCLRF